jgi:hypothetical protein
MKKSISLFTLIVSSLAFAQVQTTTGNIGQSALDLIKPDSISHFSIINGPSLNGDGSVNNADGSKDFDGASSWHQVSLRYQLTDKTRFVVNPRFTYSRLPDNTANGKLDNPVLGITTTWYQNGKFSFTGGLNTVFAVLDEGDRENGLEWNPGGFQTMNYQINNRLSAGTWLWGRYRYFRNNAEKTRAPLFVSPYVSYSVTDKLGAMAFYQVNGSMPEADQLSWDDDEHLNFSVSYRINKTWSVQPIVTVFRGTDFDIAKGNLNMWISGRFL